MTQSDNWASNRGNPQRKNGLWPRSPLVTCDDTTSDVAPATTLRDRVAVRDPRLVVTERHIGLIVTLGGVR